MGGKRTFRLQAGFGLTDAIASIMLLAIVGAVFAALFPSSFSCSAQAREYKLATAIAQRKMEQLRALEYESLTQPVLRAGGMIDESPTISPYSFTVVDRVSEQLPGGTGTITISSTASDQRCVRVTVQWTARNGRTRSVQLTTIFADRRTRTAGQ